ncbi:PGAP1 family protein [Megaselia abdita]
MFRHLFVVISLASLCFLLYGAVFLLLEVEKNGCRMTYMFEYPQFVRIHFKENQNFPKYGLYAYSEGKITEKARAMEFTGAPVVFVPGNSGSYKQARSFASVAIRKGLDNNWNHHLDYFTVDYNEEYSGLYGGYLLDQQAFLVHAINRVLSLYSELPNAPKQVVIIGHSMGGKLAQSLMVNESIAKKINTIISVSGPLDTPVINFDYSMEAFYRKTEEYLLENRTSIAATNETNLCKTVHSNFIPTVLNESHFLNDKLFISIGGGNRDILVHSGLTHSKFSDLHVLTTSIPNVWLSTDHLCAVWCLQFVLVVNRFLYSIITSNKGRNGFKLGQSFVEDKRLRLVNANHFFVKHRTNNRPEDLEFSTTFESMGEWYEDNRRVYSKEYINGIKETSYVMVSLRDGPQYRYLYTEIINADTDNLLIGCNARDTYNSQRFCSKGTFLPNLVKKLPSGDHKKRAIIDVDLHKVKAQNPTWTHLVFRLTPTASPVKLNIDINDNIRTFKVQMPKWYSYQQKPLLEDTLIGASHYRIEINDLDEAHQALQVNVKPRSCSRSNNHAVAKICVPWSRGSERYQYITESEANPIYVHVPNTKPKKYNTTANPVTVDLYLDPNCRYTLSYKNSFGGTMSRIFHQYIHWLPAHLTAILFLSLKYQISLTPKTYTFKCGKLHKALIASMSLSIITASRIIVKIVTSFSFLPDPDEYHHSMLISFIIHGSAQAILIFATAGIWMCITFNGNLVHKILLRLVKFKIKVPTFSFLMPMFEKIPITAGVVLVSIAYGSCGGVALGCACAVHFMLMSKKYEDYLEEFVFKTAKMIATMLFGRKSEPEAEEPQTEEEEVQEEPDNENRVEDLVPAEDEPINPEDEELKRLLKEAIESQKKILEEKKSKSKEERQEYDAVPDGLSGLHFHMTLFLLLCVITILNIPSTLSWAKNFHYQKTLPSDPSLIPSVLILTCLSLLWQFETPRNVHAYNFLGSVLYVCAVICIIYCQDSVYRLNGVISSVFLVMTVHQFGSSKKEDCDNPMELGDPLILDRISKMEAVLKEANKKSPQDENEENRRKEARAARPDEAVDDEDDMEVVEEESEVEDNEREDEGTDESTC